MRKKSLRILACALAFVTLSHFVTSCKKNMHPSDSPARNKVSVPRAVTYQLIWSDEFNGTTPARDGRNAVK